MTAPSGTAGIDPARIAGEVARRFPGVRAWWGEFTGAWWALARDRHGRDLLVEAADPAALGRRLEALGVHRTRTTPTPPDGRGRWSQGSH
jgi:hypothetical protein